VSVDAERFRRALQLREQQLVEQCAAGKEAEKPVELDQSRVGRLSRMDALQARALSAETQRRRQAELSRVRAALRRVDLGTFGDCMECGEPISSNRLQLDPAAVFCITCARSR
jgi:DnaK suppressor protein